MVIRAPEPAKQSLWQIAKAKADMRRNTPKMVVPDPQPLVPFAKELSRGLWYDPPHLRMLCDYLERVERGEINRLIIEMPPRHGKSQTASVYFPAWFLDRHPDKRVILTSYEAGFAATWGRQVRNLIASNYERLRVRISPDSSAASRWNTTMGGGMVTAGVGGAITGRGADLLIIDDPIKNFRDANSSNVREAIWQWWTSTAFTRLEPGAAVIIIMTRWHQDDLVGRVLRQDADDNWDLDEGEDDGEERWHRITLPAISEGDDMLGREPGQALWPERFPLKRLLRRKGRFGSYVWDALYQQRPTAPGGAVFRPENFRNRFDPTSLQRQREVVGRWISWDTALKDEEDDAYTVGVVAELMADYRLHIREVVRARWQFPELVAGVTSLAAKWNHDDLLRDVVIEDKASGISLLQTLRLQAPDWLSSRLVAITPTADKLTRAKQASVWTQNGSVCLPEPGATVPWLLDFETELFGYPQSPYADQVDAFDQCVIWLERMLAEGFHAREGDRAEEHIGAA